jgi:hypothetical protein
MTGTTQGDIVRDILFPFAAIVIAASSAAAVEPALSAAMAAERARAHQHDLAVVLATVSRFDEVLFSAIADQGIAFGSGRPDTRTAALEAAYLRLRPQLREVAADGFAAGMDEPALRGAIAFFVSDAGRKFTSGMFEANGIMNNGAREHWGEWVEQMRAPAIPDAPPATKDGRAKDGDF